MTGKQLKNSILQWAIQGKLVPQDPNDEPASVLLEKIRAEKARLVKEGKIKKNKKESIIYRGDDNSYYEKILATGELKCIDDELPFQIPFTWEWVRLRSITSLLGDGIHGTPEYDNNGTYFFINGNNLKEKAIIIKPDTKKVNEKEYSKYKKELNETTVLVSINGTLGNVAFYNDEPVMLGKSACYFNLIYKQLKDYIYLVLNSPYFLEYALSVATGTTIKNVSLQAMNNLLIPFPSITEQNRIANKIDLLTSTLLKYSKQEFQLNRLNSSIRIILKKSVLQEAIQGRLVPQDPNDEPASVLLEKIRTEKGRLIKEGKLKKKDLVETVIFRDDNKYYEQIDGTALQIEADYTFPDTWEVVKLSHICRLMDGEKKEGKHICLDAKYLRGKSSGDILTKGKFVSTGDNIILVDGENSGEVFAVPHDGYMGSTFKQLWVSENMYLPYVLYFIQFYKDLLRNSKKGAAIPHLNKDIFYSLVIGIPPYKEQERIAIRICEIIDRIRG